MAFGVGVVVVKKGEEDRCKTGTMVILLEESELDPLLHYLDRVTQIYNSSEIIRKKKTFDLLRVWLMCEVHSA